MFRNYWKVAMRNLWKHRGFSALNIFGLATGLACFLLIALYVVNELSYDRFNKKANRIYRVDSRIVYGGNQLDLAVCSDPMGPVLKKDYPQVENYARIYNQGSMLFRKGEGFLEEQDVIYADSTIFNVFTFPLIEGNMNTALNDPNTVVISASTAKKYFGTTNALGKTIENDNHTLFKVTGVMKDIPVQSHVHANFILSMKNADYGWGNFLSHNFHTYMLLQPGTDPVAFEKNFAQVIAKYVLPQAKEIMNIPDLASFEKAGNRLNYNLTPLTKIHLYSHLTAELDVNGNIQYVYIFSAVALFILLIACINFMNLSTARSATRAQEVGVRKVLGTERKNLIFQFFLESTVMAVISFLIAVALAALFLPMFNDLASKQLRLGSFLQPGLLLFLVLLPFVVGLLAGSYPAFFLSSFRPIQVLKGKLKTSGSTTYIRSSLVVFQFLISIVLITATIIVYRQLNFIQTTSLGFNKDQVLVVENAYALGDKENAFRDEMLRVPGVSSATISGFLPVSSNRNDNSFHKSAVFDPKEALSMQVWAVDYDYLKTLGMEMVKGRAFSPAYGSDSSAIILNEEAAKILGYEDPIGKKIYTTDNMQTKNIVSFTIIGIVKNFHFESLHQHIGALSMHLGSSTNRVSFKVSAAQVPSIVKAAETKWKQMAQGMPFSYQFLDDSFSRMYSDDQRVGRIALIFSILTIFIACLGLFGLATFVAEQRTKEIGIRKVLGASVPNILTMLSKDFVRLVCIAALVAVPLAWWLIQIWLEDFAYRVHVRWWTFLIAGGAAVIISLLTISYQAFRAAVANPVNNLRSE